MYSIKTVSEVLKDIQIKDNVQFVEDKTMKRKLILKDKYYTKCNVQLISKDSFEVLNAERDFLSICLKINLLLYF